MIWKYACLFVKIVLLLSYESFCQLCLKRSYGAIFFVEGAMQKFQLIRLQEKINFAMSGTSRVMTSKLETDVTHLCVCCSPAPLLLAGPAA